MDGNIEELVLSGKLFSPPSRSSSPVRTPSPSSSPRIAQWPADPGAEYEYDSDAERQRAAEYKLSEHGRRRQHDRKESIGMGPGRTGVKGVIRDSKEANALERSRKAEEVRELSAKMERANLGGKTWAEEERERLDQEAREEGKTLEELVFKGEEVREPPGGAGVRRKGRFGHLREVGMRGYVQAIENEERHIWVVIHIYDSSLDRCANLDDTLSRLARSNPATKFLRVRAGAIGFASSQSASTPARVSSTLHVPKQPFKLTRTPSRKILVPGRYPTSDGEDEESEDDHASSASEGDDGWEDDNVDTDVLPTILVYRGGELVHSWVRVDWEAKLGVEEFLRRHHILSDARPAGRVDSSNGNCGLPSDDEDFDDGELVFGGSDDGY